MPSAALMTRALFRALMLEKNISGAELARMVDCHPRTVYRYTTGKGLVPKYLSDALKRMRARALPALQRRPPRGKAKS